MSFIERALEQLRNEAAAAGIEPAEPMNQPSARQAEGRTDKAGRIEPADAIRPMPCRNERTIGIDLVALRAVGVIPPEEEERRLAEEYRIIKRPLLNAMTSKEAGKFGNVVVVTSAVPGEGKTFTSINLALSLARERNREVVLIDGDVAKRHITQLFGLDEEIGLLDVGAAAGVDLEQSILRTDVPSLFVVPAGGQHIDATEILRSERTISALASLASEPRRIVLIDSPPLLATSEAGVLTSLAGQVILVVRASETPQDVVVSAIEAIAEETTVSLVLNQVLSVPERNYGYHGYYGRYGYGRSAGKSSVDSAAKDESSQ